MRQALFCLFIAALSPRVALADTQTAASQWKIQYFYDKDDRQFSITDLRFTTPERGIAVGALQEKNGGKPKGLSIITRDGGATWTEVPLRDLPRSIFFLNESLGWMVTEDGIWQTTEGGRDWKKLKGIKRIQRVGFLDPNHGWAVGAPKVILETTDGGRTWKPVEAAQKISSNPEYTSFNWIELSGDKLGAIIGASIPPRYADASRLPNWADPESAALRREWPTMTLSLETTDGGKTWIPQTTPAFGQTTRIRLLPDRVGLILVRFRNTFEWPSEVYLIGPKMKGLRVFRAANRAVTDVGLVNSTEGFLAAIEPPGKLYQLQIPGKLRMLHSTDLVNWTEMKVDYKAFGTNAILSIVDARNVWVATDSGMILRLTPGNTPRSANR